MDQTNLPNRLVQEPYNIPIPVPMTANQYLLCWDETMTRMIL
jgi:hypothetical protein